MAAIRKHQKGRLLCSNDRFGFNKYFEFQQIGYISDSVDLLVFLYCNNKDFDIRNLKKFLRTLFSECMIPFKLLHEDLASKKEGWMHNNPRDGKLYKYLTCIEDAFINMDLPALTESITYFSENKQRYKYIVDIIQQYPDLLSETPLAKKIYELNKNIDKFKLCK